MLTTAQARAKLAAAGAKPNRRKSVPLLKGRTPRMIGCMILAIDAPEGFAVFDRGELVRSGEIERHESGQALMQCSAAIGIAKMQGMEAVLVVEKEIRIPGRPFGGGRTLWQAQWKKAANEAKMATRIVRVPVSTWRAVVLGNGRLKHNDARAREARIAAGVLDGPVDSDDEAAAICIGLWARDSQAVFEAIPESKRRMVGG